MDSASLSWPYTMLSAYQKWLSLTLDRFFRRFFGFERFLHLELPRGAEVERVFPATLADVQMEMENRRVHFSPVFFLAYENDGTAIERKRMQKTNATGCLSAKSQIPIGFPSKTICGVVGNRTRVQETFFRTVYVRSPETRAAWGPETWRQIHH